MTTHGFVLAGGLSRRMGVDKATIVWANRPLVVRALDALSPCDQVTVIHRHPLTLKQVVASHVADSIEVITDDGGGQGPLDGLRTALHHSSSELTVVLAVDLVGVDSTVIERLISELRSGEVVAALVGRDGQRQALASVWRTIDARPIVDSWFERGERSIHGSLATLDVRWVEVDDEILRNVNTRADLDHE